MTGFPALDLLVEVETPSGGRVTWSSGDRDPGNRPQGMSFGTARFDGFKDASVTLSRRIDQDYADLNLGMPIRFLSRGGDIVYEGRIHDIKRSFQDQQQITVQCAGMMGDARLTQFSQIFVDRDLGQWSGIPLNEQARLLNGFCEPREWVSGNGSVALIWDTSGPLPSNTEWEAWYTAPDGCKISQVAYRGTYKTIPTNYVNPGFVFTNTDNKLGTGANTWDFFLDGNVHVAGAAVPSKYVFVDQWSNAPNPQTAAAGSNLTLTALAVFGNHGLTLRDPVTANDPQGLYMSDVIRWIIDTYCPFLSSAGVQDTNYPVGHLVFRDLTAPYDAMITCNSYHRWGLECWENGVVHFGPVDLTDWDWELRLSDFGFGLEPQGDSIDELANGITVSFTDVTTGQSRTLFPVDYADLRDDDIANPLNKAGLLKYTQLSLTEQVPEADALQIGRAALAEFNQTKAPGTATKVAHITDRAGNLQPVWKVRAGDRVIIADHPDERTHLITECAYQHDGNTMQISFDDSAQRLEAVIDRLNTALQAAGL